MGRQLRANNGTVTDEVIKERSQMNVLSNFFFPMARQPLGGLGLIFRDFTITKHYFKCVRKNAWYCNFAPIYLTN